MMTLEQSLADLVLRGVIDQEMALALEPGEASCSA